MTSQVEPGRFESPSGLSVQVNANGSIRRIDHRDIILNLFLGTEIEGGQRAFVELDDGYYLLDVPSAYESMAALSKWLSDGQNTLQVQLQ